MCRFFTGNCSFGDAVGSGRVISASVDSPGADVFAELGNAIIVGRNDEFIEFRTL